MHTQNPTPPDGALGERALPYASLPKRKKLPHAIPSWVKDGETYFITINCTPRGLNQLATPDIAQTVENSFIHRQRICQWWIQLLVLMPDHLHGLVSFSRTVSMRRTVFDWKRYLARHKNIQWQRDFFDHRIRDHASLAEKWHYIQNNPLRKNLCATPGEWPYQWHNGQPRAAVSVSEAAVSAKPPYPR
ncbi:putative transposase [Ereboglobus sp. PH5-10]|uniref:transposase n=1 Tax=Ereboglobus sp. PH5-10 TaxID=2940629 RepID=UPI002405AEFB|nr:transposase [Ereboglobus sp. PH5-10]MDF9826627.1 putative transposase [Ereboglobus sp. PH5-10]